MCNEKHGKDHTQVSNFFEIREMLGPDAQKSMLEMLNIPSCILKFLMEKGRLGA
jgi:hypothetical protein